MLSLFHLSRFLAPARSLTLAVITLLVLCLSIAAQENPSAQKAGNDSISLSARPPSGSWPIVSFTLNWPRSEPPRYKIVVSSDGRAEYTSQAPSANDAAAPDSAIDQPITAGFTLSEATREKIFSLAQQANFFNGNFNYDHHRVADTGTKTLAYSDAASHYQTSYNWSENKAIDELTHIFEGIGGTIQSGQRLEHLMRFDKLGLNHELQGIEQAAASGQLRELQIIAPVLQQIASGASYMNIARERARKLLQPDSRSPTER